MEGPIAFMTGQGELSDWFVDSGASRHMTGNESFFAELKSTIGMSVLLANGEKAEAKGIGSGCIVGIDSVGAPVDIQVNDVLFVPNLMCMLIDSRLDRKYWGEAISTATYIQNRSTSKFKSISSFERWFGQKPNIGNFRRFGSKALVRISATMQEKALIFV